MRYQRYWKEYNFPKYYSEFNDAAEYWGWKKALAVAIEVARDKQAAGKPAQSVADILSKILKEIEQL